MSKGYSYLFSGTLGSSYLNDPSKEESYSDRGIEIPKRIRKVLSKLKEKGDHIVCSPDAFDMKDVSIMSKETGVEFAKVTIGDKSYLIRGDGRGTYIPDDLLKEIRVNGGTLDFHSHPRGDDLVPSQSDMRMMKVLLKATGQRSSSIVTTNGQIAHFDKDGVISVEAVKNKLDKSYRKALNKLFGGERHD